MCCNELFNLSLPNTTAINADAMYSIFLESLTFVGSRLNNEEDGNRNAIVSRSAIIPMDNCSALTTVPIEQSQTDNVSSDPFMFWLQQEQKCQQAMILPIQGQRTCLELSQRQLATAVVQNKARIRSLDNVLNPRQHVSVPENAETKNPTDDPTECNEVITKRTETEAAHSFDDIKVRLARFEVHLQHLEKDKSRLLEENRWLRGSLGQIQMAMVSSNHMTRQAISSVKYQSNITHLKPQKNSMLAIE